MTRPTIQAALLKARHTLQATSPTPAQDAKILLCETLSCEAADLVLRADEALTPQQTERFTAFVQKRLTHQPIAQIVGYRWFYGYRFQVTPDVLDPRPETELLIEQAKTVSPNTPHRVLDLGTGSGCLLVTYLLEVPRATGIGIDISPGALEVAQKNAQAHGVADRCQLVQGHWTDGLSEAFDIVLCNPPYISEVEMRRLAPDVVQWEPHTALTPGATGLEAYREIARSLKTVLAGGAFFEIGHTQSQDVCDLFATCGFSIKVLQDLNGKDRCLYVCSG